MSPGEPERAIVVINPNSTQAVTDGMDHALANLRRPGGPAVRCVTLAEGPPGIETDAHIREVVAPLVRLVRRLDGAASAFVDACFSDPGLAELRQATDKPVFGIAESAYRRASAKGGRFGVISILEASLARHRRYIEELGLGDFLAGDRPAGLGVTALGDDPEATFARLVQVGEELRTIDGAEVIVLGCTGMTPHREHLQSVLGVPVVDPVQAAVEAAIDAVSLPCPSGSA
ncbi:MAG: aspartate/glutamate racemase family protein [Planctomycetota bacterium]|jgi:Asp/Glu/hydantoin racemase